MTREFQQRSLFVSNAPEDYDGTTAVVRSEHLSAAEVEFMRWKAERWMTLRHVPAVFAHDPWFVLANARRMLGHTFRGSTARTWLGLESEHRAFERYRAIRQREREYLPSVELTADVPARPALSA